MKNIWRVLRSLLPFVLLLYLSAPVTAQDKKSRARNYYRHNVSRIIDHIVPLRNEQPSRLFMDMDTLPYLIMGTEEAKLIKTDTMLMADNAVHVIEYYDLDKDGIADEFHALTKEGKPSQDFGFMYDLNKDGMVDYIIFWGGLMFTHDQEFYKYLYHWVDEDYDGKIDLVTSSVVNQPGDSLPDPHHVIWIKDLNADGLVDDVSYMHIPDGTMKPVAKENGIWYFATVFGRKKVDPMDAAYFEFYYKLLNKVKRF